MAGSKKTKTLIRMISTGCTADGQVTGTFYVTKKNPKTADGKKLSLMKYDKRIRKRVLFKEGKIK
jgi:ribosomal protein L33